MAFDDDDEVCTVAVVLGETNAAVWTQRGLTVVSFTPSPLPLPLPLPGY